MEIFGDTATVYRDFARRPTDRRASATGRPRWPRTPTCSRGCRPCRSSKRQANLVFAAARWHGVPAPGPYAALRAALLGDGQSGGPIRRTILERATQTNEVGRLATLYPAFSSLAPNGPGRSLALLEVGASAGLCLYPDRYLIRWRLPDGGTQETDPVGPLLECATTGELPAAGPWLPSSGAPASTSLRST